MKLLLLAGASLALLSSAAAAQTTTPNGSAAATAGEIVVTAEKRAERLVDVPAAVSAVSARQIRELDAHNLNDITALVPGLQVASEGGIGSLVLRGINSGTSTTSPLVGIIVGGAPYGSSSAFSEEYLFPLDLDLSQVERVEVLPGPQGTLYGANSMGGLVSYVLKTAITNHPGGDFDVQGAGAAGGQASYRASGDIDLPLVEDKAGLRVSGFYDHEGGFLDDKLAGLTDVNRASTYGGMADLTLKPMSNLTINLSALLQDVNRNSIDAVGYGDTTYRPLVGSYDIGHPELEPVKQNYQQYTGDIDWNLGPVDLTSITSWGRTADSVGVDLSESPAYIPLLALGGWSQGDVSIAPTTDKVTQELRVSSTNDQGVKWLGGVFFDHEVTDLVENVLGQGVRGAPLLPFVQNPLLFINIPTTLTEYAAFGNVTVPITSRLQVTGGLRFTRDDQNYQQFVSGSLQPLTGLPAATPPSSASADHINYAASIRYTLLANTNLYARVATGFRPGGPNVVEPGVPSTFAPDSLTNYEAGLKSQFLDGRASVDVDAFYIDWSKIQLNSVAASGFSFLANGGRATSTGVEFTGTIEPIIGLNLTGTFAYTDAYLNDAVPTLGASSGERLTNTPKFAGSLIAEYRRPIGDDWTGVIGGSYRYVGDRTTSFNRSPTIPQFILKPYSMVDLHVGVERDRYRLTAFIHNLGNVEGELSASSLYGYSDVGVTRPREIGVELSASF